MEYSSINPSFGVELANGTQLVNFNDDDVTALKQLAAERGIVVARNQDMDMQAQAEFGHRLGTPMTTPVNNPGIPEELIVIKAGPKSKAVAGQQWPSDVSSEPVPPGLSMLRMEVVPSSGGDTLFADMYQAFATLSGAVGTKYRRLLGQPHRPAPCCFRLSP